MIFRDFARWTSVSTTLPWADAPADAELISAVRGGDVHAFGPLFERHVEAARRLARQLVSGPDVDDLVSDAFAKVLGVLQRGGGPDLAFRAYLLTAVRRLHVDRIRAGARLHPTDDLTPFDPGVPFRDTAIEGFENAAAARAFASLPERWQLVLWHTEVEGQKPAEVAPLLGLSPNSVSALAYRAREGLRQAFLSMHAQDTADATCLWAQEHLGAHVRGGLSRRDSSRVEHHLLECRRCTAVYLELLEINSGLSGLLAPLLLGGAAAAYVGASYAGASAGAASSGGLSLLLGRARDLVVTHTPATAVAGIAASTVAVGTLLHPVAPTQPGHVRTAPAAEAGPESRGAGRGRDPRRSPDPSHHRGMRAPDSAAGHPAAVPVADTTGPTPAPDHPASPSPGQHPSGGPSTQPPSDQPPSGQHTQPPPSQPVDDPGSTAAPPDSVDLVVVATASPVLGAGGRVDVTVTGLGPGQVADLDVTADHTSVTLAPDPRCTGIGTGHGSCRVTGSPATFTFAVAALPDAPTTLTFTVRPEGSVTESDPADNTARVRLGP